MAKKPIPAAIEARKRFKYDPATGALIYRAGVPMPGNRGWRVRAGDRAGGINPQTGYRLIRFRGRNYPAARVIWLIAKGDWPKLEIDHKNLDKSDDRWCNLRQATRAENCMNKLVRADSRSGLKGVMKLSGGRRGYEVRVQANLGVHTNRKRAQEIYKRAIGALHGAFANDGTKRAQTPTRPGGALGR